LDLAAAWNVSPMVSWTRFMWSRSLMMYGISNTPNVSATEDITDEGSEKVIWPSFSFCISSLSLPSCDEPNT
jgi:hypothetical protein